MASASEAPWNGPTQCQECLDEYTDGVTPDPTCTYVAGDCLGRPDGTWTWQCTRNAVTCTYCCGVGSPEGDDATADYGAIAMDVCDDTGLAAAYEDMTCELENGERPVVCCDIMPDNAPSTTCSSPINPDHPFYDLLQFADHPADHPFYDLLQPETCMFADHPTAMATCAAEGKRLCAAREIEDHLCCNTPCKDETVKAWTEHECGTEPECRDMIGEIIPDLTCASAETLGCKTEIQGVYLAWWCPVTCNFCGGTWGPTGAPTRGPTATPTRFPTATPTRFPTKAPTRFPTKAPTSAPTDLVCLGGEDKVDACSLMDIAERAQFCLDNPASWVCECDDLHDPSFWTVVGNPTKKADVPDEATSAVSGTATVRCCSVQGDTCTSELSADGSIIGSIEGDGCFAEQTHAQAEEICSARGQRLCSKDELKAGVCSGTGCGFDDQRVWTSTEAGDCTPVKIETLDCEAHGYAFITDRETCIDAGRELGVSSLREDQVRTSDCDGNRQKFCGTWGDMTWLHFNPQAEAFTCADGYDILTVADHATQQAWQICQQCGAPVTVFDAVTVTGISPVNPEITIDTYPLGKYFYFTVSEWTALTGETGVSGVWFVDHYRNGALVESSLEVIVMDNYAGVHGKKNSVQYTAKGGDWQVGDLIKNASPSRRLEDAYGAGASELPAPH